MINNDMLDEFNQFINEDNTKENYSTIYKNNILVINSKDRNYKLETNYNFSIHFNSLNTDSNMSISNQFKNITKISCLGVIIPNIYLDMTEILSLFNKGLINNTTLPKRFMKISDLPYLNLTISEIKNKRMSGSNKEINKATYILVLDDSAASTSKNSGNFTVRGSNFTENGNLNNSVIAETDKRLMFLKEFSVSPIDFYSTPQNYLNHINISLTTPSGKEIKNLTNFLNCSQIKSDDDSSPTEIIITFSEYFCGDEFNIGDKILFKDISFTSDTIDKSLILFLTRNEGHTILKLDGKGSGTTKLYSVIHIPYEYTIDLNVSNNAAGNSSVKNTFNLTTSAVSLSGSCINLSSQVIVGLKITNEERDNVKVHSHIL